MIKRYRIIAGVAAALMLIALAAPQAASAQAPPGGRPCAAGEKEQVTKQTFASGAIFFDFFFRATVVVTQTTTVTTYTNYRNVTGLIYILTERADGTKTEAFSFPAYLQNAYGGNLEAIKQDLRAGYLKDRGAC